MNKIEELNLGFSDAQSYSQRGNKEMFTSIFVKNNYLEDLLKPHMYFLVGEKGTGKTAYATFLSNSEYKGSKSILKFISGTDYEKFYELKKKGQIDISGFVDIWKTILLLLLAKSINSNDRCTSAFQKNTFDKLIIAIDEYYNKAFSPEIINALRITDRSEIAAKLICKVAEAGGEMESSVEFSEQRLQMNLFYISQKFADCLGTLKLSKNITLYIDGIDIRPAQIPYIDYLDCIKGLATACWSLNTELFANVRDSKGQFKIVLLLRPDIFNSINLQNATNKLADNSVYLEWKTTYNSYSTSMLYEMGNKLLAYRQTNIEESGCWEKYFDWKLKSTSSGRQYDTAFIEFLRISLSRPRDIQRILKILQDLMKRNRCGNLTVFSYDIYKNDEFQNIYSEYFLSSLKDQLAFYYSEEDYKHFIKFFKYFSFSKFSYDEYLVAYNKHTEYILNNAKELPKFIEDPKEFLQFLYDCNIIAAVEGDGDFFHFSYREKSTTNIAPEVIYGKNVSYRFHYGLYKKANFGRF